jgi:hypothetical protein
MLARSAEALFAHLIDYAGAFPPAALPVDRALENYLRYCGGEHAWMLGRFVVPAAHAHEVPPHVATSAIGVDEVKATSAEDIDRIAGEAQGRTVYVEIGSLDLLDAVAARDLRAKIRTGGVTVDAFPSTADIAKFLRACAERGVPFKATAGLHHPVRCVRPLTYATDAPRGTMHGFVNVFLAAALLPHAEAILEEEDPSAFRFEDEAASWRGHAIATEDLARIRQEFAISFGSCSFEEPVEDLERLGWL